MTAINDHYETLEVSPHASPETVEAAYRSLARRNHPDLRPPAERPAAGERMKSINEAFAILGDEGKRRAYDRSREYYARPPAPVPAPPSASSQPGPEAGTRQPSGPSTPNRAETPAARPLGPPETTDTADGRGGCGGCGGCAVQMFLAWAFTLAVLMAFWIASLPFWPWAAKVLGW